MPNERIHLDEFLINIGLSEIAQAGFRSYADKLWMTVEEWEAVLQEYQNR